MYSLLQATTLHSCSRLITQSAGTYIRAWSRSIPITLSMTACLFLLQLLPSSPFIPSVLGIFSMENKNISVVLLLRSWKSAFGSVFFCWWISYEYETVMPLAKAYSDLLQTHTPKISIPICTPITHSNPTLCSNIPLKPKTSPVKRVLGPENPAKHKKE